MNPFSSHEIGLLRADTLKLHAQKHLRFEMLHVLANLDSFS